MLRQAIALSAIGLGVYALSKSAARRKFREQTIPREVGELDRSEPIPAGMVSGLNVPVSSGDSALIRPLWDFPSPDEPFVTTPFVLTDIPVGTRVEIFCHARGNDTFRVIVKQARPAPPDNVRYTDVLPIKVFEVDPMRPKSTRFRFDTARPWILYEIQYREGSRWAAFDLPNRFRSTEGATRVVEQPIVAHAQDDPVLTFRWGGLQPVSDTIEGDEELTIMPPPVLDFALNGALLTASNKLMEELVKHRNTKGLEDIDKIETRSLTYEFLNNGFQFNFHWWIEDLLDQPFPLGGCDCDVRLSLRLKWKVKPDGTLQFYRDAIYPGDGSIACPACPIQTLVIAYAQLIALFKNLFDPILEPQDIPSPEAIKLKFREEFQLLIDAQRRKLPVNATIVGDASIRILSLWLERDRSLKARVRYSITYQIT